VTREQAQPFLYDVFLCHNTVDKAAVETVATMLRARGIRCWLDKRELKPGTPWRKFVDTEWPRIGAIAIFLGPSGISDGQRYEIDNLVPRALDGCQSVVPVLLPTLPADVSPKKIVPDSLRERVWVDFRDTAVDSIDALAWGINGENPHIRLSVGSYYRDTEGLEDAELSVSLGRITTLAHERSLSYPRAVREALCELFEDPAEPANIMLFHTSRSVPKDAYYGHNPGADGTWNLDHIWPKAFGFPEDRKILCDLHNIAPADMAYNSRRGAGFFYDRRLDYAEQRMEIAPTRHFDPRGAIARACLYMTVRYQGMNSEPALLLDEQPHVIGEPHLGSLETLLYWNRLAAASRAERIRNDRIAALQGNRNPFVDRPEFADLLWYPV
jgi:endonuclease I